MVGIEVVGDDGRRSVFAVGRTESVIDINVSIRSQRLGEFLLLFLDCLLCRGFLVVCGEFTTGLTRFFLIEAEVFEQKRLAVLQGGNLLLCLHAVVAELNLNAEQFAHTADNLAE